MERLTERLENGAIRRAPVTDGNRGESIMSRLAAYEDTGLEPEDIISAQDMFKIAGAARWIPVTERLPEAWRNDKNAELVNYMIYCPDFGVDIGNYQAMAKRWLCMGLPCKVTHWMPLPEPPKEEPQLLTRKNLYSMNDQCVWVQYEGLGMPALVAYHADDEDGDGVYLTNNLGGRSEFSEILEQGGVVYRTKPKEEPEQ